MLARHRHIVLLNSSLGPNLLTGTWQTNAGWSESGGTLTGTAATSTSVISYDNPLTSQRLTFDCTVTSGSFTIRDSTGVNIGEITSSGSYSFDRDFASDWIVVDGTDGSAFTGTIYNIELRQIITQSEAPAFDWGEVGESADNEALIYFTLPLLSGATDGTHTIVASGGAVTVSSSSINASGVLVLTLSRDITSDETVTYAYTPGGTSPLQSTSEVLVQSFTAQSLINSVTQPLFGDELLVNTWDDADSGWSETDGVLTATAATGICDMSFTNPSATMRLIFEVYDYTSGSFQFRDTTTSDTTGQVSGNGNYAFDLDYTGSYIAADGSDGSPFTGKIRNISLKEILGSPPTAQAPLNTDIGMESGNQIPNASWAPSGNNATRAVTEYRTDDPYEGTYYMYCAQDYKVGGELYNRAEVKCLDNLGWGQGRYNYYEEYWIGFMFKPINMYTPTNTGDVGWCGIIQSHSWRSNTTDHNSVNLFHMKANSGSWDYSNVGYPNIYIDVWDILDDDMYYRLDNESVLAPKSAYWTSPRESFEVRTPKWNIPLSTYDNTWIAIVMNFIASPGPHATINPGVPDGKFRMWVDGTLEVDFTGPNVYYYTQEGNPASDYGIIQTGIYKNGSDLMACGYDNIKIYGADGSYALADPS
jgi:hypothetical protein